MTAAKVAAPGQRAPLAPRTYSLARSAPLALAGASLLAGSVLLGRPGQPFAGWVWGAVATAVGGGVLVLAATWAHETAGLARRGILAIALLGVACRLALLSSSHQLSDDAERYQWDGRVLAHGVNPYLYAPDDPQLRALRADAPALVINHPSLHTVYPPLAEGLFALAHRLDPRGLGGFHALQLVAELASGLLLARALAREGLPRSRLLLAAWLPTVLLEGYLPGHVDTLTLPFVVLAMGGIERRQPVRAGAFLALAALIKPHPLLMVPAALRAFGVRGSARFLLTLGCVVTAAYVPFAGAGHWLFDSTWLMARTWSFNASVAMWLESLLPAGQAHAVAAVLLFLLVLAATRWGAGFRERVLLAVAAFVVCTPTLYPWYLIWALPLLVLVPDLAIVSILLLAPLSYVVLIPWQERGAWTLPAWVTLAEYAPFYAFLALGAWRRTGMFRRMPS